MGKHATYGENIMFVSNVLQNLMISNRFNLFFPWTKIHQHMPNHQRILRWKNYVVKSLQIYFISDSKFWFALKLLIGKGNGKLVHCTLNALKIDKRLANNGFLIIYHKMECHVFRIKLFWIDRTCKFAETNCNKIVSS